MSTILSIEPYHVSRNITDGWEADNWQVTLHFQGDTMTIPFHMGTGHHGAAPSLGAVMSSLVLDYSAFANCDSFEEYANEFGLNEDSRKDERQYQQLATQSQALKGFFGDWFDAICALDWEGLYDTAGVTEIDLINP